MKKKALMAIFGAIFMSGNFCYADTQLSYVDDLYYRKTVTNDAVVSIESKATRIENIDREVASIDSRIETLQEQKTVLAAEKVSIDELKEA